MTNMNLHQANIRHGKNNMRGLVFGLTFALLFWGTIAGATLALIG